MRLVAAFGVGCAIVVGAVIVLALIGRWWLLAPIFLLHLATSAGVLKAILAQLEDGASERTSGASLRERRTPQASSRATPQASTPR
jgi:hypothetical protein